MIDPEHARGAGAERPLPVLLGALIREAQTVGAAHLATSLSAAIVPADRDHLLDQLRRAFRSRSTVDAVGPHLALVDRVAEALAADEAAREEADTVVGLTSPVEPGGPVDPTPDAGHRAPMPVILTLPKLGTQRWADTIDRLVKDGDDARLVEAAIGPGFAGSQSALAALSGLSEESISRGKTGARANGFSATTREWLRAYLLSPASPPPPMERRPGPRARPGAIAPQVWVRPGLHRSFLAAAERSGGQSAVMDFCIERYLTQHPGKRAIETPEVPEGPLSLRVRIHPELLAKLDKRVGGAGKRAVHIRAALLEGLPELSRRDAASHA